MRSLLISIPADSAYSTIIILLLLFTFISSRVQYKRQTGETYVHILTRKHHIIIIIMYMTTRTYPLSKRPDEYYCTTPQQSNYYTEISSFSNIIRVDDDNNKLSPRRIRRTFRCFLRQWPSRRTSAALHRHPLSLQYRLVIVIIIITTRHDDIQYYYYCYYFRKRDSLFSACCIEYRRFLPLGFVSILLDLTSSIPWPFQKSWKPKIQTDNTWHRGVTTILIFL